MNRHHTTTRIQNRAAIWFGLCASCVLAACASAPKEAPPPQPDANALRIMERVKAQPSAMFGGGMVYELFVGQQFNARFDQREGELTLTDLSNERACKYTKEGLLETPEGAEKGYGQYCSDLSVNAYEFLTAE